MSVRPSSTAIGAFIVGALALLLVALLVWGGTGLFRTKLNYVLFFDTAVTGLNKGSPVLGRGVKIGEVTDVQIRWGTPLVAVYITLEPQAVKGTAEVEPARAIERLVREEGLRAQLRMQSFVTGVLYVALDFRPDTPIVLRGRDQRVPELPTIPTDLEVWTAKLERFADKIEKVPLDQIGQMAVLVLEEVKTLVHRVDAQIDPLHAELKGTLTRLDAGLEAARKLVLDVDRRVDPLATQAEAALKAAQVAMADVRPLVEDVRRLVATIDAQADPLLTSIRGASDSTGATMERAQLTLGGLDQTMERAQLTLGGVDQTLEQAQLTLGGVDQTLEQGSPLGFELFQTLKELRAAAQSLRSLADYLERVPDAPIYGIRRPSRGAR